MLNDQPAFAGFFPHLFHTFPYRKSSDQGRKQTTLSAVTRKCRCRLKKVDVGASSLAGARFTNGIFTNVGYQPGLTNISEGEDKYRNRGTQIICEYFFYPKISTGIKEQQACYFTFIKWHAA